MIVENCVRKLTKIKFTSINFGQVVPYGIDAMVFVIIITKNCQNLKSGAKKNYVKFNYCCISGFFLPSEIITVHWKKFVKFNFMIFSLGL